MAYPDALRHRTSVEGAAYIVTAVTRDRMRPFAYFDLALALARELHALEKTGTCHLIAWVIMPDHVHVLLQLAQHPLASVVQQVKGRSARSVNELAGREGPLWQRGYHEHAVRRNEDLVELARYVVMNPVRAGLVARLVDYPFWNASWL